MENKSERGVENAKDNVKSIVIIGTSVIAGTILIFGLIGLGARLLAWTNKGINQLKDTIK